MNRCLHITQKLFELSLFAYPTAYRLAYGDELQAVFALEMQEAVQRGPFALLCFLVREAFALPGAVLDAHRQARSKAMAGRRLWQVSLERGSPREAAAALAPFVLLGAVPALLGALRLTARLPEWLLIALAFSLLAAFLGALVIGLANRAPRWCLPYCGLPLGIVSVFVVSEWLSYGDHWALPSWWTGGRWAIDAVLDLLSRWNLQPSLSVTYWLLRQITYQGTLWIGLMIIPILVIVMAGILPPLRPLYVRLRADWTLLSFVLYGATLIMVFLTFDDYVNEDLYVLLATLLLAGGGWAYLHSRQPWQRLLSLLLGVALATATAATGKAILYTSPDWPGLRYFTWQTEAMSAVVEGVWMLLILTTPALLALLPKAGGLNRDASD
jgi:hypothetical protein